MNEFIKEPCPNPNFKPDLDAEGTYCDQCSVEVANLSQMTREDAHRYKTETGGCGTVQCRPDGQIIFRPRRKYTIKHFVLTCAVVIASGSGYAEIASIATSYPVQSQATFSGKVDTALALAYEEAFDIFDVVDTPAKFDEANGTVVSGVVF